MSGKAVEALASAHRRVVQAKGRIEGHEALRLRLIELNDHEAVKVATQRIEGMTGHLAYLEAVLVAVSFRVRCSFDALTGDSAEIDGSSLRPLEADPAVDEVSGVAAVTRRWRRKGPNKSIFAIQRGETHSAARRPPAEAD
jgi:hypothetical protein